MRQSTDFEKHLVRRGKAAYRMSRFVPMRTDNSDGQFLRKQTLRTYAGNCKGAAVPRSL